MFFDAMVSLESPHVCAERHRDRLGKDESARDVEVGLHALCVDLEPLDDLDRLRQCAGSERRDLGQRVPLRVPVAHAALVLLHHGRQHDGNQRRNADRGREDGSRSHRVALVRERR